MTTRPLAESRTNDTLKVRVGLVGRGIAQSRTPRMHVEEGAALGVDYRYDIVDPRGGDRSQPDAARQSRQSYCCARGP